MSATNFRAGRANRADSKLSIGLQALVLGGEQFEAKESGGLEQCASAELSLVVHVLAGELQAPDRQ